jgi:hypothetical protein
MKNKRKTGKTPAQLRQFKEYQAKGRMAKKTRGKNPLMYSPEEFEKANVHAGVATGGLIGGVIGRARVAKDMVGIRKITRGAKALKYVKGIGGRAAVGAGLGYLAGKLIGRSPKSYLKHAHKASALKDYGRISALKEKSRKEIMRDIHKKYK